MNRFVLLMSVALAVVASLDCAQADLNRVKAKLSRRFGMNKGHQQQVVGNYYYPSQPTNVHQTGYGLHHQEPAGHLQGDSAAASSAASSVGNGQASAAAAAAASNGGYQHHQQVPHYQNLHQHQPVSAPVYRQHQTPLYAPIVSEPAPIVYGEPELHHHSVGGGAASSSAAAAAGGGQASSAAAAAALGAKARNAAPVRRFYQAPPVVVPQQQYVAQPHLGHQHQHHVVPQYVRHQQQPRYAPQHHGGHHNAVNGGAAAASAAAATGGVAGSAASAAAATSTATEHVHVPHVDNHIVDTEDFEEHYIEPETENTYAAATGTFASNGDGHEVNEYVKETEDVQKHEDGREDDNHYYRADSYGKSTDKQKRERYNNYDEDIVHTPNVFRSKKSSTNYESDLNKAHRESGSGVLAKDKHSASYNKNSRKFNEKIDQRNSKHGAGVVDTTSFTSANNFNDEDDEVYDSDGVGFVGVDGVAHGHTGHTGPRSAAASSSVTGDAVSTSAAIGQNAAASTAAASGHH